MPKHKAPPKAKIPNPLDPQAQARAYQKAVGGARAGARGIPKGASAASRLGWLGSPWLSRVAPWLLRTGGAVIGTGVGAFIGTQELEKRLNLFGLGDYFDKYRAYQKAGGKLNYQTWQAQAGVAEAAPTKRAGVLAEAANALAIKMFGMDYIDLSEKQRQRVNFVASGEEEPKTPLIPAGAPRERYDAQGNLWLLNESTGTYIEAGFDPSRVYQQPESTLDLARAAQIEAEMSRWGQLNPEEQARREREQLEADRQFQLQQEMFQWQQQVQEAQQEADRQRQLSILRANPASWLEYASMANQTPTVQPWMTPLATKGAPLTVGQQIPGYSSTGSSMNLPELTTPSSQYMSRIAPSMRQQYYGYEKARTGANPEDVQWRLWAGAPPGGVYGGLRRLR